MSQCFNKVIAATLVAAILSVTPMTTSIAGDRQGAWHEGWDAWGWSGVPGYDYPLYDNPNNYAGGYPCGYGYYAYYGCPYPDW